MGSASFDKRVYAWLLDEIPSVVVAIVISIVIFRYAPSFSWFFAFFLAFLAAYIVYFLYVFIPTALSHGASLGMKMQRIKAVRGDLTPISTKDAAIKALLSGLIPVVIVNAVFMLYTHTERSPIDRLTNSLVIKVRH